MTLISTSSTSHPAQRRAAGPGPDVRELPLSQLVLGSYRPRQRFSPAEMQSLAQSIAVHGVSQPLLVRPVGDELYEIVAGERRYLAAQDLGLHWLPVLVRALSDEAALELSLVENLQRQDLNELEEAEGVLRLLSLRLDRDVSAVKSLLYRMDNEAKRKVTQQVLGSADADVVEAVFAVLGTLSWSSFVSARLPLFALPQDVLEAMRAGVLSATGARLLGRVHEQEVRAPLLAALWDSAISDAELRRRVLMAQSTTQSIPQAAPPIAKRLGTLVSALVSRKWRSPARQERARALLDELTLLLSAEENDDAPSS
jgi:ParB family transcriptional regulator, chromosome partitioning protein